MVNMHSNINTLSNNVNGITQSGGNISISTSNVNLGASYSLQTTSNPTNIVLQSASNVLNLGNTADGSNNYARPFAIKAGDTVGTYWGGNPTAYGADVIIQAGNINLSGNNGTAYVAGNGGNILLKPGYAYVSDSSAGNARLVKSGETIFYNANTNGISTNTGYTEAMRIGATGNVGIGTSNPSSRLDVSGTINSSGNITGPTITSLSNLGMFGSNTAVWSSNNLLRRTGGTMSGLLITSNNASANQLQLGPVASEVHMIMTNTSNATSLIGIPYASGQLHNNSVVNDMIIRNDTGRIFLNYSALGVGLVNSNNNIGIGTSSPAYKLDVVGSCRTTVTGGASATFVENILLSCDASTSVFYWRNSNLGIDVYNAGNNQGNNKRHLIINEYASSNAGFVGIGLSNPLYKLDVAGDINFTGNLYKNNSLFSSGGGGSSQWTSSGTNIYITNSNVGIGTTNPAFGLDVAGGNARVAQTITIQQDSPYGNGTTNRRYALIATLHFNHGFARIHGICGGHDTVMGVQTQCKYDLILNARNGVISGNVHNYGTTGTRSGVVVYRDNTNRFQVYLTGGEWFRHHTTIIAPSEAVNTGSVVVPATPTWSADTAWTIPANNTLWLDTITHIPSGTMGTDFYMSAAATPVYGVNQAVNGNVGIGTSNPAFRLDVNGTIQTTATNTPALVLNSGNGYTAIDLTHNRGANVCLGLPYSSGEYSTVARSNDFVIRNASTVGRIFLLNGYSNPAICVNSNNSVGIGIHDPSFTLDVNGSTRIRGSGNNGASNLFVIENNTDARIQFIDELGANPCGLRSDTGNGIGLYAKRLLFYTGANSFHSSNAIQRMVLDSSGNLGIGTSAPSSILDVNGDVRFRGNLILMPTSMPGGEINITFADPDNGTQPMYIKYYDNGNPTINIEGGKLGIGRSNPSYTLDVQGDINTASNLRINGTVRIDSSGGASFSSTYVNDLRVGANASISQQGIYLHWNRSGNLGEGWLINQRGGGTGGLCFASSELNNTVTEHARFDNNGNFGIGKTDPAHKLEVNGTVRFNTSQLGWNKVITIWDGNTSEAYSNATSFMGFGVNSSAMRYQVPYTIDAHRFWCGSTNSYVITNTGGANVSDIKFKSEIEPITDALDKVKALEGRTFVLHNEGPRQMGFIAQQIQPIVPEVITEVTEDDGEKTLCVSYDKLVALLTEGMKELAAEVDALKAELASLKNTMS